MLLPAVGVAEIAAAAWRRWPWFGRVFRVTLALLIPVLLLFGSGWLPSAWVPGADPSAPSTWTQNEAVAILLGLGVLLAFVWGLLIYVAQQPGGHVVPAALGLITAAAGVSLMLSGYASGGLVGLPFAGVAAGALAVCLLLARNRAMTGLVGIGTVLLFGLLMAGRFFGELTTTNFVLLIVRTAVVLARCAAADAWVEDAGPLHRGAPRQSRSGGRGGGLGISRLSRGIRRIVGLFGRRPPAAMPRPSGLRPPVESEQQRPGDARCQSRLCRGGSPATQERTNRLRQLPETKRSPAPTDPGDEMKK